MGIHLTVAERQYNAEALLVDDLWAFHPDFFDSLSPDARRDLLTYYAQSSDPEDVFGFRRTLLERDPELARRAQAALRVVVNRIGLNWPTI